MLSGLRTKSERAEAGQLEPKIRIKSDATIKSLRPLAARREYPDDKVGGLYLVIQPSSAKSWAYRYRSASAPRKLTIGPYPAIDLATARKRAIQAAGDVAGGVDPAGEKRAARAAVKVAAAVEHDLVERVVGQFIERHAKPNTRDWRETERMLKKEVVGRWGVRRLADVTRANVRDMIDEIRERGAPVRANRVFAQFRKLCNWALSRDIISASPCAGTFDLSPEEKRDRVLSDDEVRLAWRACDAIGWPFGAIGRLLLLTGARREEVAGARWSEIDLAARIWRLPKERAKNAAAHEIPLSEDAALIFAGLPRIGERIDFVFTTTGATSVSGFSRAKAALDEAILAIAAADAEAAGADPAAINLLSRWTLHDLRRTVATNLQKLGVRLEVTEAVLGHVSGSRAGVVGIYQRHDYAVEKRAALDAWARRLDAVVNGGSTAKVLAFAKR